MCIRDRRAACPRRAACSGLLCLLSCIVGGGKDGGGGKGGGAAASYFERPADGGEGVIEDDISESLRMEIVTYTMRGIQQACRALDTSRKPLLGGGLDAEAFHTVTSLTLRDTTSHRHAPSALARMLSLRTKIGDSAKACLLYTSPSPRDS